LLLKILKQVLQRKAPAHAPSEANSASETSGERDDALIASAIAHGQRGEFKRAKEFLSQVLTRTPGNAVAHDVLGNVLRGEDRIEEAITSYEAAIRADPNRVSAHSNLGLCLRDLGRFDVARASFEHAWRLEPSNPTIATNLAALLFDTGHFEEASELIDAVLSEHPDFAEARVVRGTRLLRRGEFAKGWADYEWRDRDAGRLVPDAYRYPIWNGEPTNEPLLVCCEQGLGDQIMFASCLSDLLRIAPRCIVECDPRLAAVFTRSFPDARVYAQRVRGDEPWRDEGLIPSTKTWLGSMPLRFRRTIAEFPHHSGYLVPDAAKVARWRSKLAGLGTGPKIGLSWRGGTVTTRNALRSIELEKWLPLLRQPGRHFISLQYGDPNAEIEKVNGAYGFTVTAWKEAIHDYDETAALVSALDLIISVQTSVIHLAGALNKPLSILVPFVAEWRYGDRGSQMPWYPSARLFRRERDEDWMAVIARVADTAVAFPDPSARRVLSRG
jgi:tetratricopeptide (TPR) repeat protein